MERCVLVDNSLKPGPFSRGQECYFLFQHCLDSLYDSGHIYPDLGLRFLFQLYWECLSLLT